MLGLFSVPLGQIPDGVVSLLVQRLPHPNDELNERCTSSNIPEMLQLNKENSKVMSLLGIFV